MPVKEVACPPFSGGLGRPGNLTDSYNKRQTHLKHFSSVVLFLHQPFPFGIWHLGTNVSQRPPESQQTLTFWKIKQIHEAKSLEPPTLTLNCGKVTLPTHGGDNGHDTSLWGCLWQWGEQAGDPVPLVLLRRFSVRKVIFLEIWICQIRNWSWSSVLKDPQHFLFPGNNCFVHTFKRKLEIIFGDRDACSTLSSVKEGIMSTLKRDSSSRRSLLLLLY